MVINVDDHQDKVSKRFLFHYLSAYNFNSIISGSGQPQIVRTPLEKIKIILPKISYQKFFADGLDRILNKMDINILMLDHFEKQKHYLLRQMFI